jgi:hypothetical protein
VAEAGTPSADTAVAVVTGIGSDRHWVELALPQASFGQVVQGVKWPLKMSELPNVDGQTALGAGLAMGLPSASD